VNKSTQKFFTLIDGRSVTISPDTKVLPAEGLSTLLDGIGLIDTVKNDAEEYRKQIIQECEEIKEQAEKEGFQAGYEKWTETVLALEKEIEKVRGELQKIVMPVAIKAAKKIVAAELSVKPEITLEIVKSTLRSVSQHKRITLYVSKQDLEIIEKSKNNLKSIFDELESLSIRERDDIEQGGCVIETEGGIINARLKDRWKTLEAALESLAATLGKGTTL
jgi:type III secretion protein L